MATVLNATNSVISEYLRELRDVAIQADRSRFEHNLEQLGMLAAYELSKQLHYEDHATITPLGTANTPLISDKLVLNTVLRAGLPVLHGVHSVLPHAELSFIGAALSESADGVTIDLGYVAAPQLAGKVLIIADTMLATGHTLVEAYHALTAKYGMPEQTFIVAVIASQTGVAYVEQHISNVKLIACAVDPTLNDHFFIVPGLGDAGDLLYGEKS